MRHVYIIRCSDSTYYTGITNNLDKRISDHNNSPKGAKYTKSRRPVTLVRFAPTPDRNSASKLEIQIKKLTRTKKEELIRTFDV